MPEDGDVLLTTRQVLADKRFRLRFGWRSEKEHGTKRKTSRVMGA